MGRVVVLTALALEFRAVRRHLTDVTEEVSQVGAVYDRGRYVPASSEASGGHWEVFVIQTGAGNTDAALEAERAAAEFDPAYLLFVGVAGGLKDVRVGDVVAASKVYALHAGKDGGDFQTRPAVVSPAYAVAQRAAAVARAGRWSGTVRYEDSPADGLGENARAPAGAEQPAAPWPTALTAPIVAGEQVVASKKAAAYRLARTQYGDAVAVEMEGYGALRALYARPDVAGLVVRGISDVVAGKRGADAAGWQPVAAAHAAAFAFAVLDGLAGAGGRAATPVTTVSGASRAPADSGGENVTPDGAARDRRVASSLARPTTAQAEAHATPAESGQPDRGRDPRRLHTILTRLYPLGPEDRYAWRRAGGDPSTLTGGMSGGSAWYGALTLLANGGGGAEVSAASLITVVRQDFGNDAEVLALSADI